MSRKVKTPKFLMRDFSLNISFILSFIIILLIVFSCAKEIDSTVYKDNHLKIKVDDKNLIIKNSNNFDVDILVINKQNKINSVAKALTGDIKIELLPGISTVFVCCERFEDTFEVSVE